MTRALEQIRARTAGIHERLERRLRLTRPPSSHSAYAAYLARMFGATRATELLARDVPALHRLLPDLPERSCKSAALLEDLRELGHPAAPLPLMPLPTCTTSAGLGLLYVMEGSTLGGAVVARALEAELGPLPTRYLRCYGESTGTMWRSMVQALEQFGQGAAGDQLARDAALMFETVESWLDHGGLLLPREEQQAWPAKR